MYAEIPDNLLNLSCEYSSKTMPIMTSIHSPIGFMDDAGFYMERSYSGTQNYLKFGTQRFGIVDSEKNIVVLACIENSIPVVGNSYRTGFSENIPYTLTWSDFIQKDYINNTFGEPNAIYTLSDILSTDKSNFHGSKSFWLADYEGRITNKFYSTENSFTGYNTTSSLSSVEAFYTAPLLAFRTNADFDSHEERIGVFSMNVPSDVDISSIWEQVSAYSINTIGTQYWCNGTWTQISGVVRPTSQVYAKYIPYKRLFKNADGQITVPRYDLEFFDAQLSIAVKFENYADFGALAGVGIPFSYNGTNYLISMYPLPEITWTRSGPSFNMPILTLKTEDQTVLNTYEMTFRGCVEQRNKEKTILIGQEDFLRIQSQGEI